VFVGVFLCLCLFLVYGLALGWLMWWCIVLVEVGLSWVIVVSVWCLVVLWRWIWIFEFSGLAGEVM